MFQKLRNKIPIGTLSLLFGAHQFIIHPIFVWVAWCKLYGFTLDPRIITACVVHDWGYWGKPNMDGPEGKLHPVLGALIMGKLFDRKDDWGHTWEKFTLYHSRSMAKDIGVQPSKLCVADKLATVLTPAWLWLLMSKATGEIDCYIDATIQGMLNRKDSHPVNDMERAALHRDEREWFEAACEDSKQWIADQMKSEEVTA